MSNPIGGNAIELIDLATGQRRPCKTRDFMIAFAISDDGRRLLVVEPSRIERIDVQSGEHIDETRIPETWFAVVSSDARRAAIASGGELLILAEDGRKELIIPAPHLSDVQFLPDSNRLVVRNDDQLQIWDIPSSKKLREFEYTKSPVVEFAVSPDARTLAIAERDRISLWDMEKGTCIAEVWSRNSLLEAGLFSLGFFGWAVVWGWMRRRRPRNDAPLPETAFSSVDQPQSKPITFHVSLARLILLLVVGGAAFALLIALLIVQMFPGEGASALPMIATAVVMGPILLIALTAGLIFVKKQILHSHGAELQRATAVAQAPGRTASFGAITAYFFNAPTLEAHFGEELATVRARLQALLGDLAEAPHLPAFCFQTQQEFDAYLGRKLPVSALYSPAWWSRQLILCERSSHGVADPRESLRVLLSYLLLWHHKGFRTPYWITSVVNAYAAIGDEPAHVHRVHRRLAVELDRAGTFSLLPHRVDDKRFIQLSLARDQRHAFRELHVYNDICVSLAAYLTCDKQRFASFSEFLRGLKRRTNLDEALRREFGRGLDELFDDWRSWLDECIDVENLDTTTFPSLPESVRRQIVEDFAPLVADSAADVERRCQAARGLGASGSLLGAESLIDVLTDESQALRGDAIWGLEAISGRRLGEDPAAWRGWHAEAAGGPTPTGAHPERPLEAELLDDPTSDKRPETFPGETGENESQSAVEVNKDGMSRPISTPPRALTTCWFLMVIGGGAAIFLPSYFLFETGLTWWPLLYYGVAMGVFAVSRGVGRHTRWLRLVGLLQVLGALSCDPINPVLGIVVLGLSRTKRAREYLAAQM
ncbi:MAG: hypothetical protein RIC55_01595 [Pirellulaceae bacterium]